MITLHKRIENSSACGFYPINREMAFELAETASEESPEPDEVDTPLGDAARGEREYVRERLRAELKREPSDSELDEWLRQHTEGY
jgi:hypothetical protein